MNQLAQMTKQMTFKKFVGLFAFNKNDDVGNRQALGFMLSLFCAFAAFTPEFAMADPWDGAVEWVLSVLNGGLTRSLAIIAIIACGLAAFFGKLSMDWAVKIIGGMVLVFGSAVIADAIIGAVGS